MGFSIRVFIWVSLDSSDTQIYIPFRGHTYIKNPPIISCIITGSDRRPETKQGIEGKIVRFRSGRVRDRDKYRRSEPDCRSEAINFGAC